MIGFVVGMLFIGIVMFFLISFLTKDERMTIDGIPDGWEFVRFDYANKGESFLNGHGEIILHVYDTPSPRMRLIIRKKPKQYRPFANAAEFEPHRLRWWKTNGNDRVNPPAYYNDSYHGGLSFDMCFVNRTFDDGTPFGIEVTE